MRTSMEVEGTDLHGAGIVGTAVDAHRVRLMLRAGRTFNIGEGGGNLNPEFDLGLRHDGGSHSLNRATSFEVASGIAYRDSSGRVKLSSRLNVSSRQSDTEWGGSFQIEIEPCADGSGLSFRFVPGYGLERTNSVETLWDRDSTRGFEPVRENHMQYRMASSIGYGIHRSSGVLTPFSSYELRSDDRTFRLGAQWNTERNNISSGFHIEQIKRKLTESTSYGIKVGFRANF